MGRRGPKRTYTRQQVFDVLKSAKADRCEPWTAQEVADEVGCSEKIAFDRLEELDELDEIQRKIIGQKASVWWVPDSSTNTESGNDSGE